MAWIDIFIWVSTTLGVVRVPSEPSIWVTSGWSSGPPQWVFSAKALTKDLHCPPGSYLVVPAVIHASHVFYLDERPVYLHGRQDKASSFYGQPAVPCELLAAGSVAEWRVSSHTKFFARVPAWPKTARSRPWQSVFYESVQSAASIALVAVGAFAAFAYDVHRKAVLLFIAAAFSMSVYFCMSTALLVNLEMTPLQAHSGADIAVWVGIACVFTIFKDRGLVNREMYWCVFAHAVAAILIMLVAGTGDEVQFGTMVPFGMALLSVIQVSLSALFQYAMVRSRRRLVELLAAMFFVVSGGNEMMVVLGVFPNSPTFLQVGMVGMVLFLAMALHEEFKSAIVEREMFRWQAKVNEQALRLASLRWEMSGLGAEKTGSNLV